jgi:dihydroorotate dehydrogenase (fumarate)/dihydroorotate dehydrogenase
MVRPIAFRFDAERMHNSSIRALHLMGSISPVREAYRWHHRVIDPRLETEVCGLKFDNPIGLAAGYDKNGTATRGLAALGFGFLEIGSISIDASPGNPLPRLFRLPEHEAIVVYYGLPNIGAEQVARILEKTRLPVPLGVNLVNTNRLRPETEEEILDDFGRAVSATREYADYLVLNLSCPNTETGGECFGDRSRIIRLLEVFQSDAIDRPLFLKVSPLSGVPGIETLLEAVEPFPFVSGFIFNTPGGKPDSLGLTDAQKQAMPGAVTGPVHKWLMNESIKNLYQRMDRERYKIIGIGGVFTAEDAYQKIRLGASLVQLLTALIYRGPGVIRSINRGLVELLKRDGFDHVGQAIGIDVD